MVVEQKDIRKKKDKLIKEGSALKERIISKIPDVEKNIKKSRNLLLDFQKEFNSFEDKYNKFLKDCTDSAPKGYMKENWVFLQQVNIIRFSILELIKEFRERIFAFESRITSNKMLKSSKRIEMATIIMLFVVIIGSIISGVLAYYVPTNIYNSQKNYEMTIHEALIEYVVDFEIGKNYEIIGDLLNPKIDIITRLNRPIITSGMQLIVSRPMLVNKRIRQELETSVALASVINDNLNKLKKSNSKDVDTRTKNDIYQFKIKLDGLQRDLMSSYLTCIKSKDNLKCKDSLNPK